MKAREAAIVLRPLREIGRTLRATESHAVELIDERQRKGKAESLDRELRGALEMLSEVVLRAQATVASVGDGLRRDGSSLDAAVADLDDVARNEMQLLFRQLSEYRAVASTREMYAVMVSLWRQRRQVPAP